MQLQIAAATWRIKRKCDFAFCQITSIGACLALVFEIFLSFSLVFTGRQQQVHC